MEEYMYEIVNASSTTDLEKILTALTYETYLTGKEKKTLRALIRSKREYIRRGELNGEEN